jgi:hypothetical protein
VTFKKLNTSAYPRRLWALVGFPGCGKSTFAAQLRGPLLVVDADHRFDEVARLVQGDTYQLSEAPADNVLVERIDACLRENMPAADVRTIVIDSLTAIMAPLVTKAMLDNSAGRNRNRSAAFLDKALALRLLQDVIGMWGSDVLYIYHLQEGRNEKGEAQTTPTVSRTELARLQRSINLQLRMAQAADGKRGVLVDWARRGRSAMTLVDDTGCWKGMPERIEEAVYGGLSHAEQDKIEAALPTRFASAAEAINWGFEQGCFEALQHARNAYDKVKTEHQPKTAQDMWDLWIADVAGRRLTAARGEAAAGSQF